MYIATVPNRGSPPAYLLRESYRENGKVKNRTLANLSALPLTQIRLIQRVLKGEELVPAQDAFEVLRGQPHGHVAAVLGTLRQFGVDRLLGSQPTRSRRLVEALIVARVLLPASKLATVRMLGRATTACSLGTVLGVDGLGEDELYEALDWLRSRQPRIEQQLAQRHFQDGCFVLYDLTSSYYTGKCCPLARYGHNRDGKKRFPLIVFGLLCDQQGRPIAVAVFEGNTADPQTVAGQIDKLRRQFGLTRLVLIGDRGTLTQARIANDLRTVEGLHWITALRAPTIRQLAEAQVVVPSLFDERDLAEVTSPDFPDERLIVCRNPLLADERARKRQELLAATEKLLESVAQAVCRAKKPLRGAKEIALRTGKVINRHKLGKHFILDITDDRFTYRRDEVRIAQEAALDGIYVLRSNVPREDRNTTETVAAYKELSHVEQAFRSFKTVDLKVRPIFHRDAERVKAHIFLCMLAYYVEWHMREKLAELSFDEADEAGAQAARESIVTPAQPSDSCRAKARTKWTADGLPVHSFRTLLADLATLQREEVRFPGVGPTIIKLRSPSPVQQRALNLLGVTL